MNFTLRQLQIFLAIAREENISRAAEKLYMSQSAASAALQQLEHNYDAKLFDRVGNGLRLSQVGLALRPKAEALLAHADEFQFALEEHQNLGRLAIGASLTVGNYLAVVYLAHYMLQHPDAETDFQVASTPEIVAGVLNFKFDVGLVEAEVQHHELDVLPWRQDRLLVFCSKDHPLAKKKVLDRQDMLSAKWILREPDSGARQTFDRAMHGLRSKINIFLELTHNEAIKRAVETGIGIGCLSEIALESAISRGDFVALELPRREMHRSFYIVMHKKRHPSRAVDTWLSFCNEQL